jgi:uncharacterized protein
MRNTLKGSLIVIAGCFIGLCAMSWIVAGRLTGQHNHAVTFPSDLGAETVRFGSAEDVTIVASWMKNKHPRACALLGHGIGGDRSNMADIARMFKRHDIDVLVPDFRAHGDSIASYTTAGHLEAKDMDAAFGFLKSKCSKRKIIVYGFSMGGAAALLGSSAQNADMLILEAVYADIETAIRVRLRRDLGSFGETLVLPFLLKALELKTGISPANMRPMDSAQRVSAPTLILAGARDIRAPVTDANKIRASLKGTSRLIVVPDADHGDIAARLGVNFNATVMQFVDRNL